MPIQSKRPTNSLAERSRNAEPSSRPQDRAPASNAAQQDALRSEGRAELLRGAPSETPLLGLSEEPQGETFQVLCRGMNGPLAVGGLTASSTVAELKQAVAARAGTPDDGTWYLTHGRGPLRDGLTLGDLGIGEGSTIVQQARASGGYGERT